MDETDLKNCINKFEEAMHHYRTNLKENINAANILRVETVRESNQVAGPSNIRKFGLNENIKIEMRTLKTILTAIQKSENWKYKTTVLRHFYEYINIPTKKIPIIQKQCTETFLDRSIFEKLGEEFKNCLGETSGTNLRSCFENPRLTLSVIEYQERVFNQRLDSKNDPNMLKCMDELKIAVDGYKIQHPLVTPGSNYSAIKLFLAKEAIFSLPLKPVIKCPEESEKIMPFAKDLVMLKNCIGETMRSTLLKCLTHYDKISIIREINDDLVAWEKENLLNCANEFDTKVLLDLCSTQKGNESSDKKKGKSLSSQSSRRFNLMSCFCASSSTPGISFESDDPVIDKNGDLHYRILRVMYKLFTSDDDRRNTKLGVNGKYYLMDAFSEYAGLETVRILENDILYCKRKTYLDDAFSSKIMKAYSELPRINESFGSFKRKMNEPGMNNEDFEKGYGSIKGEDYDKYMLRIRIFQNDHLPLGRHEWEVENNKNLDK